MNPRLVTLGLDPDTFARMDALRDRYFPPERNIVPAHVSLFHHLPGEDEDRVRETLATVATGQTPFPVRFTTPRKTGRGMAISVEAAALSPIHACLAREFAPWLTPQDRQPFRPHVTIMNKAEPHEAAMAFQELSASWSSIEGKGESLLLWEYLGGPWRPIAVFPFAVEAGNIGREGDPG